MGFLVGGYNDKVTVWSHRIITGTGASIFDTPRLIWGKWEDTVVLMINHVGEEVPSKAIVYLDSDKLVKVGDYLALGDFTEVTDPLDTNEAWQVESVHISRNPLGFDQLVKVML